MNWNKQRNLRFARAGLLGLCVSAAVAAEPNLLRNGSFETVKPFCRPEDNNDAAKPFVHWDTAGSWHGSVFAGTIAADGDVSALFTGGGWLSQYAIPVRPGARYRITGRMRTRLPLLPSGPEPRPGQTLSWGALGTYGAYVKIDAADKGTLWAHTVSGERPWHTVAGTFTAPAEVTRVTLSIGGYRPGFPVWADDFRLTEIP
jgi:hypothetical protein